jgi:hypothetical protein
VLEGSASVLILGGALACALGAWAVAGAERRRAKRAAAEAAVDLEALAETRAAPLDRVAQEIAGLVAAEKAGGPQAMQPLLPRDPLRATEEFLITQDVEAGLLLLSRAIPDVRLHDSNLVLLAKLRAALGAPGFYLVCCKLAALLNAHDPAYQDLSAQLARGQLGWAAFLAGIHDLQLQSRPSRAVHI